MDRLVLLGRDAGEALEQLVKIGRVGEAAFFRNALDGEGRRREQLFRQLDPLVHDTATTVSG